MPGRHVTDRPVRLYMSFRRTDSPVVAAAKAASAWQSPIASSRAPRLDPRRPVAADDWPLARQSKPPPTRRPATINLRKSLATATTNHDHPHSDTPLLILIVARFSSRSSRYTSGARSARPSSSAGAASGSRSSPSSRSRPRSAGSATPPTPSRACAARCSRPSATRGTSRAMTQRSNWSTCRCDRSRRSGSGCLRSGMLPSRNWRQNSGSSSRSKTDFRNRLTHGIQYRPLQGRAHEGGRADDPKSSRGHRRVGAKPSHQRVLRSAQPPPIDHPHNDLPARWKTRLPDHQPTRCLTRSDFKRGRIIFYTLILGARQRQQAFALGGGQNGTAGHRLQSFRGKKGWLRRRPRVTRLDYWAFAVRYSTAASISASEQFVQPPFAGMPLNPCKAC